MSDSDSKMLINAVIGAVVTVALSFTGVSPVIGGAVAGYLERTDGVRVGALSGLIAAVPVMLLGLLGLLFVLGVAAGDPGAGFALVFVLFAFVFVLALVVGMSALGGYIGVYLWEEFGRTRRPREPRV